MKLTDRSVGGLLSGAAPRTIFDSELKGFGVRCLPPSRQNPTGSRSWIVEYRPGAGGRKVAKRRMVLGPVAKVKAADARRAAVKAFDAVRRGEDPARERRAARDAPTIRELVFGADAHNPGFHTSHESVLETSDKPAKQGKWKPRTSQLYASYWNKWILPELGRTKACDLVRADVARLHRKITASHPVTANRCVTLLRHFYVWAARIGEVPESMRNLAVSIDRHKESPRQRYLTPDELERLSKAMVEAETVGIPWREPKGKPSKHRPKREEFRRSKITPHAAAALRLLLLTGARLREILHLRWENVDLGRGVLFLDDSKTGAKVIVLSAEAQKVIDELRRSANSNGRYVILGDSPDRPRADLQRPWALVCRGAGLTGVRLHDLRHTFASYGASGGAGLLMIGGLLGHKDPKTTARYAHLANAPLRRAADLAADGIVAAMRGPGLPASGELPNV